MGEIADMMIDGTMCPCGEFIDDGADGPGYPQYCSPQCKIDYGGGDEPVNDRPPEKEPYVRFNCDICHRPFKTEASRDQHRRDKHG